MLPHDPIEHGPIQRVRTQMCGPVYIYFSDAHQVVCYQRLHDPFTKVFSEKTAYLRSSAPICKLTDQTDQLSFGLKPAK
jgi:hypothetical protein